MSKENPRDVNNETDKNKFKDFKSKLDDPQLPNKVSKRVATIHMNMEKRIDKDQKIQMINDNYKHPLTYINCDLRYFNFDFLVDKLGSFDGKYEHL